jgi:hypothetical protein
MLGLIFALVVGMIIGTLLPRTSKPRKGYDESTADWFIGELENKLRLEHDSVNRWRKLAVRQQTEIRVLHLIHDQYPEARDERSKLAALRFELEYVEDEFTTGFSRAAKARMIGVCKDLLWSFEKSEPRTVITAPSLPPRPPMNIRVGAHSC